MHPIRDDESRYTSILIIKDTSMYKKIAPFVLLFFCTPCFALFQTEGKVSSIIASGGKIIFNVCTSEKCDKFYIIPDSDYKKTVISMVLAAKVSGKVVWVGGGDTTNDSWPYNGARSFSAIDFKG
jgi:hypothetical protein